MSIRRPAHRTVDAYITAAPKAARQPPVYFAGSERYVALYAGWPETGSDAKLLAPYRTSKGTLKFSVNDPLPAAVITRIVKARVKQSDALA